MTRSPLNTRSVSRRLLAGCLLAALPISACGSTSSDSLESSAETPETVPAVVVTTTTSAATTAAPTTALPTTTVPTTALPTTTTAILERALPADAQALAAALTDAEHAVRDSSVADTDAYQWGQRQQRLYRLLADNPEWADAVLESVDQDVHFAVSHNWDARKDLSKLVASAPLAQTLPAWRLREPLPAQELLGYYQEAESQTGVPWNYLAAINLVETRMGRIQGLSTAGATGPMQFLPSTWEECCEGDPTIDRDAIIGAGVCLRQVGADEDIRAALYRYNNSDRYVNSVEYYAQVLAEDELAYRGYHAWQVYFLSASGLLLLPSDYYEPEPVPVEVWLQSHPDALLD